MKAKLFEVKKVKEKGKGLFAKQFIPIGTITWFKCDKCREFTRQEIDSLSEKRRKFVFWHAYKTENGNYILPCDEASFTNHSCNANTLDSGKGFDIVVRDIEKGEEVTYDYRFFYDIDMVCKCGEENCCKRVKSVHPIPEKLQSYWNSKIEPALRQIKKVPQPLDKYFSKDLKKAITKI